MTDLADLIELYYSRKVYLTCTTRYSSSTDWGDKRIVKRYMEKYWLTDSSCQNNWKFLHESIFSLSKELPDMIFKKDFEFISLCGGGTFIQKDFGQLMSCIKKLGERNFVVIQDTSGMPSFYRRRNDTWSWSQIPAKYALKMKYPVNISWDELMSGNFISTILFEFYPAHYYVFGDSGQWGMYAAHEYINTEIDPAGTPIRIIGFNPKYRKMFRGSFEIPDGDYCENLDWIPKETRPNLKEWVPKLYRNQS